MPTCVETRWKNVGCTHDGRVYFRNQDLLTKGYVGMGGYLRANVCHSGRAVHRIIAETLVHNPAPEVFDEVFDEGEEPAPQSVQGCCRQCFCIIMKNFKNV